MMRAPRDEFNGNIWEHWRDGDYEGLFRYMFGATLYNPSSGSPDGSIDPGGGGFHNDLDGLQGGWGVGTSAEYYHFNALHHDQLAATIGATGFDAYQTALYGTDITLLGANSSTITRDFAADGSTSREVLALKRTYSGGAGADGIGGHIAFYVETETEGTVQAIGLIKFATTDATAGTQDAFFEITPYIDGTSGAQFRFDGLGNFGLSTDTDLLGLASGVFSVRGHAYPGTTNAFDLGENVTPLRWRYLWSTEVAAGNCNSFQALIAPSQNITTGSDKLGASFIAPWDMEIVRCSAYAQVAPTGADIILDAHKNGVSIWPTQAQRLTIAAGANAGNTSTFGTTALAQGDRLTFDVDQVGSTVSGANVTFEITFRKTALI